MKKGQAIWAIDPCETPSGKKHLTVGKAYEIIEATKMDVCVYVDTEQELYFMMDRFYKYFSLTPPHEVVLIAEQPKEKTAEEIHDELHAILNMNEKDLEEKYKNSPFSHPMFGTIEKLKNNDSERLFQAAVAAMQGMLIREKTPYVERLCNDCWNYAEALINEGKKRGHL